MNQLDISRILVNNKYRLDVGKFDSAVYVVDIPKVSKLILEEINNKPPINKVYKEWCKLTKRNGGVLIGSSIKEFFEYYERL